MYNYILKSLKIGFWILTPLLFISNTKVVPNELKSNLKGNYDLIVSGAGEQSLKGNVFFETSKESTNEGIPFANLSLEFVNEGLVNEHAIQFLISRENQLDILDSGRYQVSENIEGFLNRSDGVFGYANVNTLGEQPFFSNKGAVVITQISKDDLYGYINVNFENVLGKKIVIKGNFHAVNGN